MGDGHDGHSLHLCQRCEHLRLGLFIEHAGCLVEDQDERPAGQGAGDSDALSLATGEADAALADPGFQPIGQGVEE